jgi:predicted transcriptional regulator
MTLNADYIHIEGRMSTETRIVKKAVTIWIPADLMERLDAEALRQDRSRNYVAEKILAEKFLPRSVIHIADKSKGKSK